VKREREREREKRFLDANDKKPKSVALEPPII